MSQSSRMGQRWPITGSTHRVVTAIWVSVWKKLREQRLLEPVEEALLVVSVFQSALTRSNPCTRAAMRSRRQHPLTIRQMGRPAAFGLQPLHHRESQRKADRKEELRHDRVGIAAVGIVMMKDRMNAWRKSPR